MDTLQMFEDESDPPTGMNPIPIFENERNLPKAVAGLELSGVQRYPHAELGVGIAFHGPRTKATAYLYNLGLAQVSSDVKSEQLLDLFRQSYAEIDQQVQSGAIRDFQLHTSTYLHLPPDAAEPIGLWAAFSFDPPADRNPAADNRQISHLVVRADRGHFNKIRYTHPRDHGVVAVNRFKSFVAEWTAIVQAVSTDPDRAHPWIDYDALAMASDADESGVGRNVPDGFRYMRAKTRQYMTVGPHLYRSQDALGRPDPTLGYDQLEALMLGVQQIFAWQGLTPETALQGIGTDGFDQLVDLFHFRVIDRSRSSLPGGGTLERALIEHVMHGPERQLTLFNVI